MIRRSIIICLLVSSLFAEEGGYKLGEGKQIASLPLYLGGYFSADYRHKDGENRYRLDDVALLGYGSYNKFSYMAELEFKEFYTLLDSNSSYSTQQDRALHTERLYVDYTFNESYMLRVGKYNSQIGFWNLLPINVLRDTTSNPMSTQMLFPKFTTGLYASYTSFDVGELKVDTMIQHNDDFDANYNNYQMDEHYGLGVSYEQDDVTFKVNVGMFDNLLNNGDSQTLYYLLGSFKYETENYKIMSEIGSQRSQKDFTTEYAGYLQGIYHFNEQHAGILRLESYNDKYNNKQDNISIFAYTYRPIYPIALKSEYQFHTLHQENQFLFSFSVLF